jgi:hypothetical protein
MDFSELRDHLDCFECREDIVPSSTISRAL